MNESQFNLAITNARKRALINSGVENLIQHCQQFMAVPGDVVECGSFRGGSAMILAACADYYYPSPRKTVFAFDTFSGYPRVSPQDERTLDEFTNVSFVEVQEATKEISNLVLIQGDFLDTFPKFKARPLSVVSIDCDLYESHLLSLKHFWPMISPGGACLLMDYATGMKGAAQAVEEFFAGRIDQVVNRNGLWGIIKGERGA